MPTGLLEVTGGLDGAQFWPSGGSDADTVNIGVSSPSFRFSESGTESTLKDTTAFDNAHVKGQTRNVIHGGKVTIRLQGIDAPELHFAALLRTKGLKQNGTKFRQFFGETSTVALGTFVKSKMLGSLCRVLTRVDQPNEVFDKYGRLIGDVFIPTASGEIDINHWLAEHGWAFPTYYNSMRVEEIVAIQKLAEKARKGKRWIWGHETINTSLVDLSLIFRPNGQPQPTADVGPVMMPKLFRRRIRFYVSRLNHLPHVGSLFKDFLARQEDGWMTRSALLAKPDTKKPPKSQGSFAPLVDEHDLFSHEPGDLVLFEADSTLVGANGKPITSWK
jgi:endonuclease YncB( thermonuclease family)